MNINEAASIVKEKVQEICQAIPAFSREIDWRRGKTQEGKDYCKYLFKNGSYFDNVAAVEKSRGKRRHGKMPSFGLFLIKLYATIFIYNKNKNRKVVCIYMKGYIYKIRNKENGKVYVGKTFNLDKRLYDHMRDLRNNCHHSHKLQRAFNKYGENAFDYSYKEYEIENEKDLNKLEIKTIEAEDSYFNGYNETLGGEGHMLKIDYHTRVIIYNILQNYAGVNRLIAKYFNCDHSVIDEIAKSSLYKNEKYTIEEYNDLISRLQLTPDNLKENYIPHNDRKLSKERCLELLSVITSTTGYDKTMCEIFNIDSKLTYRLRRGMIYQDYIEIFNNLSEDEKSALKEQTFQKYDIEAKRAARQRKSVKDPLTQEQVDFILDNTGIMTQVNIAKELNISTSRVSNVQRKLSYLDLIKNYENRRKK